MTMKLTVHEKRHLIDEITQSPRQQKRIKNQNLYRFLLNNIGIIAMICLARAVSAIPSIPGDVLRTNFISRLDQPNKAVAKNGSSFFPLIGRDMAASGKIRRTKRSGSFVVTGGGECSQTGFVIIPSTRSFNTKQIGARHYFRLLPRIVSSKSTKCWSADTAALESNQKSLLMNSCGCSEVKIPAKFKPYPFPYHKELDVQIESLTNLGFGIARVYLDEDADKENERIQSNKQSDETQSTSRFDKKWVIMVPNVIPGERVLVRIYRNYPTYSDADLLQIVEPSPDRVFETPCSLSGICGGCQYQHITIERQRHMKTAQVQELYERIAGLQKGQFPSVLDTLGTNEVFGYRSKITPHYDAPIRSKRRRRENDNDGTINNSKSCEIGPIGFKEKASRRLVDVPYCHIATSDINDALVKVREEKRMEAREGKLKKPNKGATLLLRDAGDGVVETNPTAYVKTSVRGLQFRFQAGNFFQNNPFMLPKMVDLVVEAAKKESPTGNPMTHLIDCYCGSGLFAIGSSSSFQVCVGIEVNDRAVEEARENASLNGIENCAFVSASAEAIFKSKDLIDVKMKKIEDNSLSNEGNNNDGLLLVGDFPRDNTVVIVDPPRKGCSEEFLKQLDEYMPQRVVYMSCDPATQARDAKFLVSFGYEIVSIQPFDLFPQTRHIECLAVFERK